MFSISINGTSTIDGKSIADLIAFGGVKWTRNDIDGSNAGRSIDGVMHRDFITTKDKLELSFVPLTDSQLSSLLTLVEPSVANPTLSVTYSSPRGTSVTKTMYMSTMPASFMINRGTYALWSGVTINLIEV